LASAAKFALSEDGVAWYTQTGHDETSREAPEGRMNLGPRRQFNRPAGAEKKKKKMIFIRRH
jgi:hypothetical protein